MKYIRKLFYFLFSFMLLFQNSFLLFASEPSNTPNEDIIVNREVSNVIQTNQNDGWPQGPETVAQSAVLMEAETGAVLYSKNMDDIQFPASITKIMSTLLALEKCSLDETVTVSHDAIFGQEDLGSHIACDVGEELTLEQSLYAVMLTSANEVTYSVGEHVGGSMKKFVKMMNQRAKKLGCKNTNFANPNGLHNDNHYTSAYDFALIAREAWKNDLFRTISGTTYYTIPPTNTKDQERLLDNHHKMLRKTDSNYYEYCVGGKTGGTTKAKNTLVTFAEKDGMTLICVVMRVEGKGVVYQDTRSIMDYGFENFKKVSISEEDVNYKINNSALSQSKNTIFEASADLISVNTDDFVVLPKSASIEDCKAKLSYDNDSSDTVGTISYTYSKQFVGSADVELNRKAITNFEFGKNIFEETKETPPSGFSINFKLILIIVIVVLLIAGIGLGIFLLVKQKKPGTDHIINFKRKKKFHSKFDDFDFRL